jgi:hypothetical protein
MGDCVALFCYCFRFVLYIYNVVISIITIPCSRSHFKDWVGRQTAEEPIRLAPKYHLLTLTDKTRELR